MNDPHNTPPMEPDASRTPDVTPPGGVRRSPIRPAQPAPEQDGAAQAEAANTPGHAPAMASVEDPTNPNTAMNALRLKMQSVADEYAQGKINRAQFNALYKRYSEQRTIIERLLERNPDSEAWRQVIGVQGQTGFLRQQFGAQPLFYVVYHQSKQQPLVSGGKPPRSVHAVPSVVQMVWQSQNRPKTGLGRKQLSDDEWLVLAIGDHAVTITIFSNEPSTAQARLVRDLHADFERANQAALARGWLVAERMVFPQRALVET